MSRTSMFLAPVDDTVTVQNYYRIQGDGVNTPLPGP